MPEPSAAGDALWTLITVALLILAYISVAR